MKLPFRRPRSITLFFTSAVFLIIVATVLLVGGALVALLLTGVIQLESVQPKSAIILLLALFAAACICVGTAITFISGRVPLKPIYTVVDGLNRLGQGDYATRIHFGDLKAARPVEESFNALAAELESTEMLRSDFINSFSHEFKTPIVSISGFARLLREDLPREKQLEYLGIIEEEALRLADMATNVLNLTKIENQSVLKNISEYNLTEQLRVCILMLENKWTSKNIELQFDSEEYTVAADEELMKQVWLNLLDNAVKFSRHGGAICISISKEPDFTCVSVSNEGEIAAEHIDRIFNKFYQADKSHSSAGNGVGLAIVKKIVSLHRGEVSVISENGTVKFTVSLPNKA